jgi:hypothetical protein
MKTKQMIFFLLVGVFVHSLVVSCSLSQTNVSGDVFIVTKGGQNFKLGLVPIAVFSDASIQPFIQMKLQTAKLGILRLDTILNKLYGETEPLKKDLDEKMEKLDKHLGSSAARRRFEESTGRWKVKVEEWKKVLEEKNAEYSRGKFLFSDLPAPIGTTKTDADGKFTLELESGKYVLAASSSRMAGDTTEKWIRVSKKE